MYSPLLWHENLPKDESELVMELVKGKQYANELQGLLQKTIFGDTDRFCLAKKLAQNVLRSFTESLDKIGLRRRPDELPQTTEAQEVKSQDHEESKKRLGGIKMTKVTRVCCKKRKEVASCMIVRPTMEDDYAWRKYGQKKILSSRHPRSYFRCTHKYDQGCKAIKQVQKVDRDPKAMYRITYFGRHACKGHPGTTQIVQEIIKESSYMINSGENNQAFEKNTTIVPSHVMQENGQISLTGSNIMINPSDSEGYSSKMGSFDHTQEVASRFYASDASISLEALDINDFSQFSDFPYEDFEFLD